MSYPVQVKIDLDKNTVDRLFRKIGVKNINEFVNKKLRDEMVQFIPSWVMKFKLGTSGYLQMISEGKKGKKKKIKTQQDNYNGSDELNLSSSGSNKDDSNLIMVGGIAGEEVQKFGMNLKSFSSWRKNTKD